MASTTIFLIIYLVSFVGVFLLEIIGTTDQYLSSFGIAVLPIVNTIFLLDVIYSYTKSKLNKDV